MPDQEDSESQTNQPTDDPSIKTYAVPPLAKQNDLPKPAYRNSSDKQNETAKLERDIRAGERWLIGIGVASVVISTVIALIYHGQLRQMRKATEATGVAATAAQKSSDTAEKTLQEIQRSSTDTHALAVAAGIQANAANVQASAAAQSVREFKRLADDSEQSIKASQISAQKALDVTIENARLDQRPWIGVRDESISLGPHQPTKVEIVLVNSGKTPAY